MTLSGYSAMVTPLKTPTPVRKNFRLSNVCQSTSRGIDDAPASQYLETRLGHLIAQNTSSVYRNVCRSLYEKDKLLFAFLMAVKILSGADSLDLGQFTFFLTGGSGVLVEDVPPNPTGDGGWLPERAWVELVKLSTLPGFEGLADVLNVLGQLGHKEPHREMRLRCHLCLERLCQH